MFLMWSTEISLYSFQKQIHFSFLSSKLRHEAGEPPKLPKKNKNPRQTQIQKYSSPQRQMRSQQHPEAPQGGVLGAADWTQTQSVSATHHMRRGEMNRCWGIFVDCPPQAAGWVKP